MGRLPTGAGAEQSSGLPKGTLIVGRFSSQCADCGRDADPHAETHAVLLGYGPQNGQPGCGVCFEHLLSAYAGEEVERLVREMRPDLHWIG